MELGFLDYLILLSVLQGLLVGGAVLLVPYFRSPANRYLGWFLLLLGVIVFLGWQDQNFDFWWLDWIWSIMWEYLLVGVLLRYFLVALNHPFQRSPWSWFFFGLFGVFLVADLVTDMSFLFGWYELPFTKNNPHYQFFEEFEDMLTYWLFFLTVIGCFLLVLLDTSTAPERRRWLLRFSYVLLSVIFLWFLTGAMEQYYDSDAPFAVLLVGFSGIFWWTGYYGVYRQRLAEERTEIRALRQERPLQPEPETTGKGYERELRQLMVEEELYRDPDLGRQTVAERLGISEGYLSEQMRTGLGQGFVDFVNGYRVRAARAMLTDATFLPYSLEAIGREAGFKSRSSFYSSFKKATGQTPGAYRKHPEMS